jgi:hypothetical protein
MNEKERLQLNKMIKINNVEDQTNQIRTLKHSSILEKEIKELLILKEKYREQPEVLLNESIINCNFLYNNYTDIYNRVKKDEINIELLFHFIHVLSQIEEGIIDQHDGSFMIGKLLKEIYIDSALKKAEKLDNEYGKENIIYEKPVNIDWKQWKKLNYKN